MAYLYTLGAGQQIYLDYQQGQTLITVIASSPGQQQQASSRFTTGHWTTSPQAFRLANGILIWLETGHGQQCIQVQGTSISPLTNTPSLSGLEPIPGQFVESAGASMPTSMPGMEPMKPMEPMEPMEPMRMGNMEMNLQPMEMRMGNMEMRMGSPSASSASTPRFCSQCGASVDPSDRFCSSCGNRLKHD